MSRTLLVGIIGLLVLLVAVTLNFWLLPEDEAVVDTSAPPQVTATPSEDTQGQVSPAQSQSAAPQGGDQTASSDAPASEEQAAQQDDASPSFDIVRVDPEGNAVIAGRSTPNAEVLIMDGDREIGRVTADGQGEWVFIPSEKLPAGESVIRLKSTDANGTETESEAAVVLVIPEAGQDVAGRQTEETGTPLAVLVPKDEAGQRSPAVVLQAPSAPTTNAGSSDTQASNATSAPSGDAAIEGGSETAQAESTARAFPDFTQSVGEGVSVDIIDYDESGDVVFQGRSEPGTSVEVFIDGTTVGEAVADASGVWSLSPDQPVAPGTYDLRVDKVAPTGVVAARVQLPFVRAGAVNRLPTDRLVVIQPGNNLWRIAARVYGSGTRYVEIHQANSDQIRDPDLIYPGQVFGLPQGSEPSQTN